MDDFLTKPIQRAGLQEALERWARQAPSFLTTLPQVGGGEVAPSRGEPLTLPSVRPVADDAVIDAAAVRSILDLEAEGATGLFDELLASFREDGAQRLTKLRRAVEAGDARMVRQIAHTLRGEALAWGAEPLAERCLRLECDAHDEAPLDDLEYLFRATVTALETIRARAA